MKTNQTQTPHHGGHHCLLLMCTTYYRAVKKIQKIMAMPAVRAAKWSAVEFTCRRRRHKRWRFDPCVGKIPWGRKCYPLQCSCLENSMDRGAWQPTVRGVAKGQTRLSSWVCTHRRACCKHPGQKDPRTAPWALRGPVGGAQEASLSPAHRFAITCNNTHLNNSRALFSQIRATLKRNKIKRERKSLKSLLQPSLQGQAPPGTYLS